MTALFVCQLDSEHYEALPISRRQGFDCVHSFRIGGKLHDFSMARHSREGKWPEGFLYGNYQKGSIDKESKDRLSCRISGPLA